MISKQPSNRAAKTPTGVYPAAQGWAEERESSSTGNEYALNLPPLCHESQ